MQKIISLKYQENLLKNMAVKRVNRHKLSDETGISEPTIRKMLDSNTPIIVNSKTYNAIDNWIN